MASLTIGRDRDRSAPARWDYWMLLAMVALIAIGLLSIYSASVSWGSFRFFKQQLLYVAIGIVPFSIFAFTDVRLWQRLSPLIYGFNVLTLLLVRLVGASRNGAERWIMVGPIQFQPSELSKILVVITLATFFSSLIGRAKEPMTFFKSLLHVSVPASLIFIQPHLGATFVTMLTWLAICAVAGVPVRLIGSTFAVFATIAVLIFSVPPVRKVFLKDYQISRIEGRLAGASEQKGKNYQTDRAAIAFGVGGMFGVGFLNGEQKAGKFIPFQHTDFVLTIPGEEFGLLGCTFILLLFGLLFARFWLGILYAKDPYCRMLAAGLLTVIAAHMIVNMGMVLHILPVVGLWLPFLSYGGTAMWLCMACVGLMLNVRSQESKTF